ncbi:MAG: tRNA (N6-threonylcarbamoyladenosine(37)-N6)-methyltransferase TrmO [Thermoplasmata archaeon]|nr:MAG: tRNA (N6-threonylcarbamoyladenosine(37)-N6)-methyltransferase TrmO [Thermoplasmata archaeon]
MGEEGKTITLKPIGFVKNQFDEGVPEGYESLPSEIVVKEEFSEGLHKLEESSHIMVVFWMDRIKDEARKIMKMHPKGREDLPLLGVFATRSPKRPNPMGIRAVRLMKKEKNVITVLGLDALNGSPILDIKPYSSKHDFVEDAKTPWWAKHLNDKLKV